MEHLAETVTKWVWDTGKDGGGSVVRPAEGE